MIYNNYNTIPTQDDPVITLKLPQSILMDLKARAEDNGQSLEVELALRLARSLERDLAMIDEDNGLAAKAFEQAEANPALMESLLASLQ